MDPIRREIVEVSQEIERLKGRLSQLRRQAEPEPVGAYVFETAGGPVTLDGLFDGRDDLLIVHNMGRGCSFCTMWADGFVSSYPYLKSRAAFALVNHDAPEDQRAFAAERGWIFPVASARANSFTADMGFLHEDSMMPGVSAFRRQPDGSIVRVALDFFGPGDDYCAPWRLFDLLQGGAGAWEPAGQTLAAGA